MEKIVKIMLAILLPLCLVAVVAQAQLIRIHYVNLTLTWEQAISPDFYGWKVWYSTTSGGPYEQLGDAIIYDGEMQPDYSCEQVVVAPGGSETTFYFMVNAWDKSGNFSNDSNEVSYKADFLPPDAPVLLRVTVQLGG